MNRVEATDSVVFSSTGSSCGTSETRRGVVVVVLPGAMTERTGREWSAAAGVARSEANQRLASAWSVSVMGRPAKRGRIWSSRCDELTSNVPAFQRRSWRLNVVRAAVSKRAKSSDEGISAPRRMAASMALAGGRASSTSSESASPTICQIRFSRCWLWMKQRLAPLGMMRTPKPRSLPSRMSRARARGFNAAMRDRVRVVLGLPVS